MRTNYDTYDRIVQEFLDQKFEPKQVVFADHEHGRVHVCVRNIHDQPEVYFIAEKATDSFFSAAHLHHNHRGAHSLREALWMIGIEEDPVVRDDAVGLNTEEDGA